MTRTKIILLISKQFISSASQNTAVRWLIGALGFMLLMAAWLGWSNYRHRQQLRTKYQQVVRKQWLGNPDKHPHRMAHYGYFAFRPKHPLSFFDTGMESFTGVSVFLEAHKQNTVNFSEASLSTGTLRFGEMSVAMLLQLLVPLLAIFIGFNSIAALKEDGTLKIMLCQGLSWQELMLGKALGIISIIIALYLPMILLTILFLAGSAQFRFFADDGLRLALLCLSYLAYFIIWALITVLVSGMSKTSKAALSVLLAGWLLFMIVLPRGTQALGSAIYKTPSKAAFDAALEEDLKKDGDRHNPNDPHFKAIEDSLLQKYKVNNVNELPFNYAGFLMYEGEKISSAIYNNHRKALLERYEQQNNFNRYSAFFNPYIGLKNLSMALAAADFASYMDFQDQAEAFRYTLAQKMNQLQIDLISNKKLADRDKPYSISKSHWQQMPDFKYRFNHSGFVLKNEAVSLVGLLFWLVLLLLMLQTITTRIKSF